MEKLAKGRKGVVGQIRQAIGATPTEEVNVYIPHVYIPQTGRLPAARPVASAPTSIEDWEGLREKTRAELKEMGCLLWEETSMMALFPQEWYDSIPQGYWLVNIMGKRFRFMKDLTPRGGRFGALAFGIMAKG